MQSRSGSITGWAVLAMSGSTGASITGAQSSRWPTSATKRSEAASSSTGRPASQVANRRSPQGRGAVLAAFE